MTGVLLVFGSLLLQAVSNTRQQINRQFFTQMHIETQRRSLFSFASLRLCVKNLLAFIIARGSLIVLLWHGFAGHTILTLYPFPKINKLTAFRTERTDGIVFPLDWFTAGWTLHES